MVRAWRQRVEAADWDAVAAEINEVGGALLPELLTPAECAAARDLYGDDRLFRRTIDMGRHNYGQGEYRYFHQPYPQPIEPLKQALYPRLLPIARDWWTKLGRAAPWPDSFDDWLKMCHRAGQTKPTALMLKYGPGDWNALHRDLYGDLVFPLQVVINSASPVRRTPVASFFGRAKASSPVPRHRHHVAPRPRLRLHHERTARPLDQGMVGGTGSTRGIHGPFRRALHPGLDLPRRGLTHR